MRHSGKRGVLWLTCQMVGWGRNWGRKDLEWSIRKGGKRSKLRLDFSVLHVTLISPLWVAGSQQIFLRMKETWLDLSSRKQIQTMMQKMNQSEEILMAWRVEGWPKSMMMKTEKPTTWRKLERKLENVLTERDIFEKHTTENPARGTDYREKEKILPMSGMPSSALRALASLESIF